MGNGPPIGSVGQRVTRRGLNAPTFDSTDWFGYDVIELRYFYPEVLGPLREDLRYKDLIQKINQQRGLNPDGTVPENTDVPTISTDR